MKEIVEFWNSSSWVANILTIVLGVVTVLGTVITFIRRAHKSYTGMNNYNSLLSYIKAHGNSLSLSAIKHRKIAIIDDQPENYPIEYLRKRGFDVTTYQEVSLADYSFIEKFDLIFLDITNVVKEDPKKGGFELIKRVRSEMKDILIVGVSSKRFDPTLTEFFSLADTQAKTPISEKDCEDLILSLLRKSYSPEDIAKDIDQTLVESQLSHRQHRKTVKTLTSYINHSINHDQLIKSLTSVSHKIDIHGLATKAKLLKGAI